MRKLRSDLRFVFTFFVVAILVASSIIGLVKASFFNPKPQKRTYHSTSLQRGQILDRNGEILAMQIHKQHLTFSKPKVQDIRGSAKIIAKICNMDASKLEVQIKEKKGYGIIKKEISEEETAEFLSYKEQGYLKGFDLETILAREYPLKTIASHVIGFTDAANIGRGGVEAGMNDILFPSSAHFNSGHGNNVTLTIDKKIQFYAEEVAQKAYADNDADSVMFIVMDAKTGEILALTSRPTYDPNDLSSTNNNALKNICATDAFEPGSVFKIFSIGAALDSGVINKDSQFFCNGQYTILEDKNNPIVLKCLGNHQHQNFSDVIKNSCNAGTASIVSNIDNTNFYQALKDFGFGEKIGLEFSSENPGIFAKPKRWSVRSKPTIAIGQEILTTALQLTKASTVYTNQGKLLQPFIIKRVNRPNGSLVYENNRRPLKQVVSPTTADLILSAMEQNTLEGTGKRAKVNGIKISTKTGTAQVIDPNTKAYSSKAFYASCLAILPTEDPQIIIYGGIMYPKTGSIYGASIVAPLIKQLAIECIYQLNLDRESDIVIKTDGTIRMAKDNNINLNDTMPNLIGLSKRDILQLFSQTNASITVNGTGWVVKQSPLPGEPINETTPIILELQ